MDPLLLRHIEQTTAAKWTHTVTFVVNGVVVRGEIGGPSGFIEDVNELFDQRAKADPEHAEAYSKLRFPEDLEVSGRDHITVFNAEVMFGAVDHWTVPALRVALEDVGLWWLHGAESKGTNAPELS